MGMAMGMAQQARAKRVLILLAVVGFGSAGTVSAHAAGPTVPATAVLGSTSVGPGRDIGAAGLAEAFRVVAPIGGDISKLTLYLDGRTTATRLQMGLYADAGGHPGELLSSGALSAPFVLGGWNEIAMPRVALFSGRAYWIAFVGTGGKVGFRDRCCGYGGTGASEVSAQTTLTDLPAKWTSGQFYPDGPLSGYASIDGGVPVVRVGNPVVEAQTNPNDAGIAEAFHSIAADDGWIADVSLYLDSESKASTVAVGIYGDNGGHPGSLLTSARATLPISGDWNSIRVPPVRVAHGEPYWIAVLSPTGSGQIAYRDRCCGGKGTDVSETSLETSLESLPTSWSSGKRWPDGPLSAYARPAVVVNVTKSGNGTGSVTAADPFGNPEPIDCGSTCSAIVPVGSAVILHAVAHAASAFTGWTGDCNRIAEFCPVIADGPRTVDASFVQAGTLAVDVTNLPEGTGGYVVVTGPGGYLRWLDHATTIDNLAPGVYQISANAVDDGTSTYKPAVSDGTVTVRSGETATVTVDYFTAVSDATTVESPLAVTTFTGLPGGDSTLTLTPGAADGLAVGDILAIGVGPATPYGLLGTVTGVRPTSDGVVVDTTPAAITDAIPRGAIDLETTLTDADVADPGDPGATDVTGSDSTEDVPGLFVPSDELQDDTGSATEGATAPATRTTLSARATRTTRSTRATAAVRAASVGSILRDVGRRITCSAGGSLTVSGSVSIAPSVDLQVHWGGIVRRKIDRASFNASATATAVLGASVDAGASCKLAKTPLGGQITLRTITFFIGGIPVVIVPRIQFYLSATAGVSGRIDTNVTQSLTAAAGITYTNGQWSASGSVSRSASKKPPTPTAQAEVKVQAGPELTLLLYGVAGPMFDLNAGIGVSANPTATPWWKLTASLNGGATFTVPSLGLNSGRWQVFNQSWLLAQATSPLPPPADTTPPSTPTGFVVTGADAGGFGVAWTASNDNVGVSGYDLFLDGDYVSTTPGTSFWFSDLGCGTGHTASVEAHDAAGNMSGRAFVSGSTTSCGSPGGGGPGGATVSVSKGAPVRTSFCTDPSCAYVVVNFAGFGGGSHTVTCYSTDPPAGAFYTYTTAATTSAVCIYGFPGYTVWATVDGVESNHLVWPRG
jgi:hypothetical protein